MLARVIQVFVLVTGLVMLISPTINMLEALYIQKPLEGALVEAKRPKLEVPAVLSEDFQRKFTAWFEQHWGLRATAARFDNSFNYYVLHESRPDKGVQVGANQTLFLNEQIWFYNRQDNPREEILAFAKLTKLVQDALSARGKELLIVLLPSKTTLYANEIPNKWRLDRLELGSKRPCEANVYAPWVAAMTAASARFIDGRKLVETELAGQRDLVYVKTGRHLNAPAACIILDRGFDLLPNRLSIRRLDCRFERVLLPAPSEEEFDLLRLMNVWNDNPREPIAQMLPATVPDDDYLREAHLPNTIVVGSSFSWTLLKQADRNLALGRVVVLYYNTTLCLRDKTPFYDQQRPVPTPQSDEWRQLVIDDNELFLLPIVEEYIPFHNADFLMQLAEAFGIDTTPFKKILTPPP